MKKRSKKIMHRRKRNIYPAAVNDEFLGVSMTQFEPALYGAVTGIATAFADNMLNIDPKIKGAVLIGASAFIPAPDSVKGAIAGKGGEILARSMGILSDELDGFIAVSDEEISEIADMISDEIINDDELSDIELAEVINDDVIQDNISDEVQI